LLITTSTGLSIFGIANPSQPNLLSVVSGFHSGVEVQGSYLYTANAPGFHVIDISVPNNPQVIGTLTGIGSPSLSYSNGFVFGGGLFSIDVRVPTAPRLSTTYPLPGSAADHLSRGDTVYVAMNSVGVRILRHHALTGVSSDQSVNAPREIYLSPNYPNPFNSQTRIEFALPTAEILVIRLYDILGREVKTVFQGRAERGRHAVSIDATSLSTGVYFYQLLTESGKRISKPMVIIK
jgi:hypothetical protein